MNGVDGVTNQEDIWHSHASYRDGNIPKPAQATIQEADIVSKVTCQNFVKTSLNKNVKKRAKKTKRVEFDVGHKLGNLTLLQSRSNMHH